VIFAGEGDPALVVFPFKNLQPKRMVEDRCVRV